jgi:EAL domain-containing protein (putative c-di-GMP-specific phosphodiesterase class I)
VRAIIATARSLSMRLVTEGLETEAQRAALASGDLAVEEMQGFLFSRPLAAEARAQLLHAQRTSGGVRFAAAATAA